jgi:hypothetical protein
MAIPHAFLLLSDVTLVRQSEYALRKHNALSNSDLTIKESFYHTDVWKVPWELLEFLCHLNTHILYYGLSLFQVDLFCRNQLIFPENQKLGKYNRQVVIVHIKIWTMNYLNTFILILIIAYFR